MTHYVVQFQDGGGHTMGWGHHHILCNLKMMLLPGNCMSSTILKLDQIVCCGQIVRWLKWWIKTGEMSNTRSKSVKGWGLGTLFVLVSPCFMKNVVFTCKIGSFLCSLDNLLQKNVIVFFFRKSNFKMVLIWKRAIFDLLFTFFSHQGKLQKFLQHISHSHTYMYFAHPIDFFVLPILTKIWIYQVWFLFGMSPGVDSYSRHIGTINK